MQPVKLTLEACGEHVQLLLVCRQDLRRQGRHLLARAEHLCEELPRNRRRAGSLKSPALGRALHVGQHVDLRCKVGDLLREPVDLGGRFVLGGRSNRWRPHLRLPRLLRHRSVLGGRETAVMFFVANSFPQAPTAQAPPLPFWASARVSDLPAANPELSCSSR